LRTEVLGKRVDTVGGNFGGHKFTFYLGDPNGYQGLLADKEVWAVNDRNCYVELEVGNCLLLARDGANIRYLGGGDAPRQKSRLLLSFTDSSMLNFTASAAASTFARTARGSEHTGCHSLSSVWSLFPDEGAVTGKEHGAMQSMRCSRASLCRSSSHHNHSIPCCHKSTLKINGFAVCSPSVAGNPQVTGLARETG